MVRPPHVRLLLVVAGCLALAAALVPIAADVATGVATGVSPPAQSSSINDTASTRRIQLMAGGLAVLGISLIGITVWFWRSTRPEPESLAPLEMMGRRRWRRLDTIEQRHRLDDVRAHLNDEAAEAARETVAPVPAPMTVSPSSADVSVPAMAAGGTEQDDSPVGSAPPDRGEASADEVTPAEVPSAEVSEVDVSDVKGSDDVKGSAGVEGSADVDHSGDEGSGEHAKVHGDPLVRAMEKDGGAG